ncbi:MAG: TIGR02757 family protein [Bacteroidales bacterium]
MTKSRTDIISTLEEAAILYNQPSFIKKDPISIPHQFTSKEDIEISGFLTSIISWGRRDNILKSANKLMSLMDNKPYDFLINSKEKDLRPFENFIYRTFQGVDCIFLVSALREVYQSGSNLEDLFSKPFQKHQSIKMSISECRNTLLSYPHLQRSEKHLANPLKGSAAKRINMFLRWMVRKDNNGVDFGIWNKIPTSALICPLDVHSGRVARHLGLLNRKQNDWKAAAELTTNLKELDIDDPIKYDFALFGLGVNYSI